MKVGLFYYSKSGNTKKLALMIEEKIKTNKVDIEMREIEPIKHPGFFKGGYNAYREKMLPISNTDLDLKEYDMLIVGTPVWAGKPAPFIQTFLNQATNIKGKKISFFFTSGGPPEKAGLMSEIFHKWSKQQDLHMMKKILSIQMKKGEMVSGSKKINGFIMDMFTK